MFHLVVPSCEHLLPIITFPLLYFLEQPEHDLMRSSNEASNRPDCADAYVVCLQ